MSLGQTTLSAGIDDQAISLPVTSASGANFPGVGVYARTQLVQVGGEYMWTVDGICQPQANVILIRSRGAEGTQAVAHDILTEVSTSPTPGDFAAVPVGAVSARPPYLDDILTIGEDLAFTAQGTLPVSGVSIPIPTKNTTFMVNKASAAAITLISATGAAAGLRLRFLNQVAAANTITYTPGFLGDTTASDVATAAAKVGAAFEIQCGPTGLWAPVNTGTGTGWTLG